MRSRAGGARRGKAAPEAATAVAAPLAALAAAYETRRAQVDASYRRMQAVVAGPHRPAEARAAAADLSVALRGATRTVTRAVRIAAVPPPPLRRRSLRRRKAGRAVPADVHPWSAELVRLAKVEAWLRRTTLDDLGVHVPTVVRVGSLAATGPHIAGMVTEPDDLTAALHEPRIGVDLQATVDEAGRPEEPPVRASSSARAA